MGPGIMFQLKMVQNAILKGSFHALEGEFF